jgi:hypothetical protein
MLPAVVSSAPQPSAHRRCCSWCRCDLGPLEHPSQHDTYGICASCTTRYFAHLYEGDQVTEELRVRVVGTEWRGCADHSA